MEGNSSYDFIFFFSLYEVFSTYKSFIFTDGPIIMDLLQDNKGFTPVNRTGEKEKIC